MELSCDSMRYLEDGRPTSSKIVELHVLFVPDEQWDGKLNKVPVEAIGSFISAGFIRVYPDMTLRNLRSELGMFLGKDIRVEKLSFMKCVGRSLAVVKHEQESDLKVKTFAPPYAAQPELYLLPVEKPPSSDCSRSLLTMETRSSSPDHQAYYPHKSSNGTPKDSPVRFPLIPQGALPSPRTPGAAEEEEQQREVGEEGDEEVEGVGEGEGEGEEEEGCCSTDRESEEAKEGGASLKAERAEVRIHRRRCKNPRRSPHDTLTEDVGPAQTKDPPWRGGTTGSNKDKLVCRPNRGSGLPESLEDRQSGFSSDRLRPSKGSQIKKLVGNKPKQMVPRSMGQSSMFMIQNGSQTPVFDGTLATNTTAGTALGHDNRDQLIEEIKMAREERRQLEWTRQELLRKGKDLLAQNRNRRNQARDSWKKKYFETKKAMAPMEETLRNLHQEEETLYNKLLHQLQARDGRSRTKHQGKSSTKNELIIQIMSESHEIDNLRRQVEDAKMKLITEIRLRKQASTELRVLRAELAQKKNQSIHYGLVDPQPLRTIPRNT